MLLAVEIRRESQYLPSKPRLRENKIDTKDLVWPCETFLTDMSDKAFRPPPPVF